ncbi:MAG: hypothetical protein WBH86_03065 [Thermogutta sp.]|nr:hypothetical protein [Thermogutta sp.]HPU05380.1 hypothetical protein [Thermogutta sp.]
MSKKSFFLACTLTVIIIMCMLVLGERVVVPAPSVAEQPFANSVEQRAQMISELRAIRQLLSDQNTLLREQNRLLSEQLNVLKKISSGESKRENHPGAQASR